jgi:hypothetical protein
MAGEDIPSTTNREERGKKQRGEGPCGRGERGSSWSASPAAKGERRRRLAGCRGGGSRRERGRLVLALALVLA